MFNKRISKFVTFTYFPAEKKSEFTRHTSNTNKCITNGVWTEMSLSKVQKYPEYGGSMLLRNAGTYLTEFTNDTSQKILILTRTYVNRTYVTTSNIPSVIGELSTKSILHSAVRILDTTSCTIPV
jgi:hypothetical protein